MGTAALDRQLGSVDAHTRFCYEQGYTEAQLSQWESHVSVKGNTECDEGRESSSTGPKQSKRTELFFVFTSELSPQPKIFILATNFLKFSCHALEVI